MRNSSLPDQIEALCRRGVIASPFRVADVATHCKKKYSPNYINVVLANLAKDTGNYVKRGSKPRFVNVARGLYKLA